MIETSGGRQPPVPFDKTKTEDENEDENEDKDTKPRQKTGGSHPPLALPNRMNTSAIFFPFDLFGSGGSAQGANLLADELREILADNREETLPTRARVYTDKVRLREIDFATLDSYTRWRQQGRQLVRAALKKQEFLLWFSGNHLGALPVYDELAGSDDTLIVQFDAHLDIHQFHNCSQELSHGNFLLHIAGKPPSILNVGHRDLLLPPDSIAKVYSSTASATQLALEPAKVIGELQKRTRKAKRIFLDLDCDVFDPIHFPAVGQPVPFGLLPATILGLIEAVWSERVQGMMISEFDPGKDREDRSLSTLVWLIEWLLLKRYEPKSLS